MEIQPIRVEGLARFQRALRQMDAGQPKLLRQANNQAAQLVVDATKPKVPRRTGRAAESIKVSSTRTSARVKAGGRKAPYYPWLDFGGRVGRQKAVRRAFLKQGRYLWATVGEQSASGKIQATLRKALLDLGRSSGVVIR